MNRISFVISSKLQCFKCFGVEVIVMPNYIFEIVLHLLDIASCVFCSPRELIGSIKPIVKSSKDAQQVKR